MGTSLTLFKLYGIEMRVHWSFLLIVAYYAFIYSGSGANPLSGAAYGVLMILLLFLCVTLHELGHALVAKYYKINVPNITLLPIGGVANLERMPDKPMQEFLIAIAGPLVNIVLAAVLAPFAGLALVSAMNNGELANNTAAVWRFAQTPGLANLVVSLAALNLLLALFNLLPAFPMDGGRILRALLAMAIPYVQATRTAVLVGRLMAGLFALWGIMGGGVFLLLIAFFVYVGGGAELEAVESRAVLKHIHAEDALTPSAVSLYSSERVSRAVDLVMSSYQTDYPVLDLSSRFIGVLTRARLIQALRDAGPESRIVDVMLPADDVPTASPRETLDKLWERMMQRGTRVVAVKDGPEFLGLITLDDISEVFQVIGAKQQGAGGNRPPGDAAKADPSVRGAVDA
ncbi:MAG: site-2 protease family protein [Caldilineaceae bacterium]|nr:site-2 protease family protein [Caldilineaceae bacterium]